jgi:phosphatidylglycerophosphate synthase
MNDPECSSTTVIILGNSQRDFTGFMPTLARVGTLPVVLRTMLSVKAENVERQILCVNSTSARSIEKVLHQTQRLPKSLEWYECVETPDLAELIRQVAPRGNIVFVLGDRTYHPSLLRKAIAWNKPAAAMGLRSGSELVGVYALSRSAALQLATESDEPISTLEDLHNWTESRTHVELEQVEQELWQRISRPADQAAAENKLNKWLVKPTDGTFARMNRKVSIPISRWLIKMPITPNMVTLFTLWVSFGAGLFLAYGGYWATLLGAVLSAWASILDGCDGEVARLKLQVTDFGCWLETVCDYLYYVFIFGGMIIGFTRTIGAKFTLTWGPLLLFGAVASFLAVGFARHHFAAGRPEAFLSIWQKKAEARTTNPFLFLGRHCEFIIRRCFLPYAFLAFAILNILPVAFVMAAVGANVVWCIALYSCFALSRRRQIQPLSNPVTS